MEAVTVAVVVQVEAQDLAAEPDPQEALQVGAAEATARTGELGALIRAEVAEAPTVERRPQLEPELAHLEQLALRFPISGRVQSETAVVPALRVTPAVVAAAAAVQDRTRGQLGAVGTGGHQVVPVVAVDLAVPVEQGASVAVDHSGCTSPMRLL